MVMFEKLKKIFNKKQDSIKEHIKEDSIVEHINEIIDNWMCDNPTFVVLRALDKIKEDKSLLEHYFPNIEWVNVDKDYICNKLFSNNISLEGAKLDGLDRGESIELDSLVGQSLEGVNFPKEMLVEHSQDGTNFDEDVFSGCITEPIDFEKRIMEKTKQINEKKNDIDSQALVGQSLEGVNFPKEMLVEHSQDGTNFDEDVFSGCITEPVDFEKRIMEKAKQINEKKSDIDSQALVGQSLEGVEFSQLNKENTNSEYKDQEIIDIALERVGNPFANCDLGPMTSESYVKCKSLIIEEILLDKSLSNGLSKEEIEQLLDVVYGEKAKGTFVELFVGRLTKSKFELLKNQFLKDKNLNREFNPHEVCRLDLENCNFDGVGLSNLDDKEKGRSR